MDTPRRLFDDSGTVPPPALTFHPGVAAVLSLVVPGAGQMYRGDVGAGLGWLTGTALGYLCFIVPGLILHTLCIFAARRTP